MLWHGSMPVVAIYMLRLLETPSIRRRGVLGRRGGAGSGGGEHVAMPVWGRLLDRYGPSRVLAVVGGASAATHLPLLVLETPLELVLARVRVRPVRGCDAARDPAAHAHARAQGHGCARDPYSTSFQCLAMGFAPFMAGLVGPVLGLRAYFALNIVIAAGGLALWAHSSRPSVGRGRMRDDPL